MAKLITVTLFIFLFACAGPASRAPSSPGGAYCKLREIKRDESSTCYAVNVDLLNALKTKGFTFVEDDSEIYDYLLLVRMGHDNHYLGLNQPALYGMASISSKENSYEPNTIFIPGAKNEINCKKLAAKMIKNFPTCSDLENK